MAKKKITPFYVLEQDFCTGDVKPYDIMPILINEYEAEYIHRKKKPKNQEEFVKFINIIINYLWWAKTEHEFLITSWPQLEDETKNQTRKIDKAFQIRMNFDLVIDILIKNIGKNPWE